MRRITLLACLAVLCGSIVFVLVTRNNGNTQRVLPVVEQAVIPAIAVHQMPSTSTAPANDPVLKTVPASLPAMDRLPISNYAAEDFKDITGIVTEDVGIAWEECFAKLSATGSNEEFAQSLMQIIQAKREAKPVAGADVKLEGKSIMGEPISQQTVTDNLGEYRFALLPPGKYRVTAESSSQSQKRAATSRRAVINERVLWCQVDLAMRTDLVSIKGRITDADGKAIAGATVTAVEVVDENESDNYDPETYSVVTDPDGSYEIPRLSPTDIVPTFSYLTGAHPRALNQFDIRVEAPGLVAGNQNSTRVPLVTDQTLGLARGLLNSYLQMAHTAGLTKIPAERANLSLPPSKCDSIRVDLVVQ